APQFHKARQPLQIVVQQVLAQRRRQIGLGVIKKGSDVIMQRSFASPLVVEKEWLAFAQHYVARLEIAIKKIIPRRAQQEPRKTSKIHLKRLLAEWNISQLEKVILEVIQVPGDRLPIKTRSRITDLVIQITPGLHLESRQFIHYFAIRFNHGRR